MLELRKRLVQTGTGPKMDWTVTDFTFSNTALKMIQKSLRHISEATV